MKKTTIVLTTSVAMGTTLVTAAFATSSTGARDTIAMQQAVAQSTGGPIQMDVHRQIQKGECAEGYSASTSVVEGKYVVYECTKSLRCEGDFKTKTYEELDAGGHIIQHYRCTMLDKAQQLYVPAED